MDTNIEALQDTTGVTIKRRGDCFRLSGKNGDAGRVARALKNLYVRADREISVEDIHMEVNDPNGASDVPKPSLAHRGPLHSCVACRTETQRRYLQTVEQSDITISVGPAGTGKTYLAVACALHALQERRISRVVLSRPVVEAGERLGFLPGDLEQKIDPYLRPLQDAMHELVGKRRADRYAANGQIEIAPLAFMRGRTLHDSFVILDEAQNTTVEQMKMFLTRFGQGSKMVVTGDVTQVDLPSRQKSGLLDAESRLVGIRGVSVVRFGNADVVRHPVVRSIDAAYGANERQN